MMQIIVDLNDHLRTNNSSNVELTSMFIFFEHNNEYYPCDDWIDNPAVILGWWIYSLVDLLNGGKGQGICFMEGPYDIAATLVEDKLSLVSEDEVICWTISIEQFAEALIKALRRAARLFHEMGYSKMTENFNDGIDNVRDGLERYRNATKI